MTFAQLGEALDRELDESGGYWFNDTEKSYFLNKATDKFVKMFYEQFEVNEHARANLRTLVKDSAPQAGSVFNLASISDLFYVLKVSGVFSVNVNGTSSTITRQIKPEQNDDLYTQDPFEIGTNADPKYEEVGNTLVIKSTTAPTSVTVRYLSIPVEIDIAGNPTGELNLPDHTNEDIIDLAKDMALENMGSPRYPQSKIETNENIK